MAISYRSQTFQDTRNALLELDRQGQLSKENFRDKVAELGVDPDDFIKADNEFDVVQEEGQQDFTARGTIPGRIAGRAIGEAVEGIGDFAEAFLPDAVTDTFSSALDAVGEYVPEALKEVSSEIFDPYHGDGAYGTGERLVGDVASYFIPAGLAVKGANLAAKGLKLASPGARAVLTKTARKAGRRGRKAGKIAGYGTAGAFGTTVIEDPRDNLFDMLMEDDQSEEALKKLKEDPTDPTALDYIDAFVKNAAIEIPAAFALSLPVYLRKAYVARKAGQPKQKVSFLGKLGSNFSSRLGTDDKTLGAIIKRSGAAKKAMIEADGLAKELDATIKKEIPRYNAEIESKMNNALQYSDNGLANAEASLEQVLAKEQRLINKAQNAVDQSATDKALKKLYKFQAEEKAAAQNVVNQLRRNKVDYDELAQQAPESRMIIDEMRTNIDDLSQYVEQNVVRGKLQARIGGNKGFYLNRSYQAFDDPEYAKNLRKRLEGYKAGEQDEIIEGTERYLLDSGIDPAKIPETLESLVATADKDAGKMFSLFSQRSLTPAVGSSKVLSKRGDIPQEIRALWGEVKAPQQNYIKTFEKLSTIKAENDFLEELARDLIGKGVASTDKSLVNNISLGDIAEGRLGKILGRGKVDKGMVRNPLENVYIDETYARAIKEGLDEITPTSGWAKGFMLAKGATQTAKTVYSPATHGRNLIGNIFMLGANGLVPGYNSGKKAITQTAAKLAGKNNRELAEAAGRYAELGITESGIGVNLIRRNLNSVLKGSTADDWFEKTALTRGTKKANTFLTNLYQAEDDLFKIIHFEKTKDYMRKAFPDKPLDEIEELAAQRTRDMMPNYSLVPRAVKALRGAPVGDFIAFPAEMIRTTKNLVKYTLDDLSSGNSELRKQAAKRLAGMTAIGLGGDALSNQSRQIFGITDDQEESINGIVPSYEQFQNRIYTSGIDKDKRGNVGINYVNLGPLDPYAYLKTGAKVAHKMIADGGLNESELEGLAIGLFDNQLGPFMEPSMLTKAMFDLANGRNYQNEPTTMGKIQKAVGIAVDPFKPGVLNFLEKRRNYEQTKAGTSKIISPLFGDFGEGKNLPEGVTPSSFTISGYDQTFGGDVGLPAFFGVRNQRLDMTAGLKYALDPSLRKIKGADAGFVRTISDPTLYSEADADTIFDAYKDSQRQRLGGFQELKALTDNYRSLFGEDYAREIVKGLKLRGKKDISDDVWKNLNLASSNYYIPTFPSFGVSQRRTNAPIPRERIIELYQALQGNRIEDE